MNRVISLPTNLDEGGNNNSFRLPQKIQAVFNEQCGQICDSSNQIKQAQETRISRKVANVNFKRVMAIRRTASGEDDSHLSKSKITNFLRKFTCIDRQCSLCFQPIDQNFHSDLTTCPHSETFCESCLHQHLIFLINDFRPVTCPEADCDIPVNKISSVLRSLPIEVQRRYSKMGITYETLKYPTIKLCTEANCEKIVRQKDKNQIRCTFCLARYCNECLLLYHEGQCTDKTMRQLEKNLYFRQCRKCKLVIEKSSGCNHMICRCRYQFCYICKDQWNLGHICKDLAHIENQVVPIVDCSSLHESCGYQVACFIKLTLKFLSLLVLCVLIAFFLIYHVLKILVAFFTCVIMGMFFYSVEFVRNAQAQLTQKFLILIFPLCMFMGVITAFTDFFFDFFSLQFSQFIEKILESCTRISKI